MTPDEMRAASARAMTDEFVTKTCSELVRNLYDKIDNRFAEEGFTKKTLLHDAALVCILEVMYETMRDELHKLIESSELEKANPEKLDLTYHHTSTTKH